MQVLENVLDTAYLEHLQYLVRDEITWGCLTNSAYSNRHDDPDSYSFAHVLFEKQNNYKSDFYPVFLPAILTILNKFNYKKYTMLRSRLGLTTKNGYQDITHPPHVDYSIPHKVIIFYINPSSGPTTIYQEKYTNNSTPATFNISNQVAPVANRSLMFDGAHYHSSSKPTTNNFRFVLNIDFQPQ